MSGLVWASKGAAHLAGPMTWAYALGEVGEFLAEVRSRDWSAASEEFSDACFCLGMALHATTGWNFPLIGGARAYHKFAARRAVWREIFAEAGVPYRKEALIGGGNYDKPEKVTAALVLGRELAAREQE